MTAKLSRGPRYLPVPLPPPRMGSATLISIVWMADAAKKATKASRIGRHRHRIGALEDSDAIAPLVEPVTHNGGAKKSHCVDGIGSVRGDSSLRDPTGMVPSGLRR